MNNLSMTFNSLGTVLRPSEMNQVSSQIPIRPGTVQLSWGTKSCIDDDGILVGDASGTVNYSAGVINWIPNVLPVKGTELVFFCETPTTIETGASNTLCNSVGGVLPYAPIVPASLTFMADVTCAFKVVVKNPSDDNGVLIDADIKYVKKNVLVYSDQAGNLIFVGLNNGVPAVCGQTSHTTGTINLFTENDTDFTEALSVVPEARGFIFNGVGFQFRFVGTGVAQYRTVNWSELLAHPENYTCYIKSWFTNQIVTKLGYVKTSTFTPRWSTIVVDDIGIAVPVVVVPPDAVVTVTPPVNKYVYTTSNTFNESSENDGSIATNVINMFLTGDKFTGANSAPVPGVTFANVPSGLTASVIRYTETLAGFSLTGSAVAHENANDVANLTVAFSDSSFVGGKASEVVGAVIGTFAIDFTNVNRSISYDKQVFMESVSNDGATSSVITFTLSNDTFTGGNGSALGSVINTPTGMTAVLVKASATTATLTLTGNATAHANINDVNNLTVSFLDSDFTGGSASTVRNSTITRLIVDFADARAIEYSARVFTEGLSYNGSIVTSVTLTITGDTFAGTSHGPLPGVSFANVPAGLTPVITRNSDTYASLYFTGSATAHDYSDSVNNFTVSLSNASFTSGNAVNVVNATKNDISIIFAAIRTPVTPVTVTDVSLTTGGTLLVGQSDGSLTVGSTTVGNVNSATGDVTVTNWTPNATSEVVNLNRVLLLPQEGIGSQNTTSSIVIRTATAPLRPGSFSVSGMLNTGATFSATADIDGFIESTYVGGIVDYKSGIARLWFFTNLKSMYDSAHDFSQLGIPGVGMRLVGMCITSSLRYNAVAYSYLPLDADLLGIDPVRLPSDGRVPIFRPGGFVVIGHTGEIEATVSNGQTVNCARERLSRVRVVGHDGAVINTGYSTNLNAGTVTFSDVSGYSQPVKIQHRIEDMMMASDVQINGQLTFTRPLTHDYPLGSYVSSALVVNDLRARVSVIFDQTTWNGSTWADSVSGSAAVATFNDAQFPITVTNRGALTERWLVQFTNTTAFNVIGENVGVIASGNINTNCAPINPATGVPYFTIPALGWGAGWTTGNVLRFNTIGSIFPVWCVRTVQQGPETVTNDNFTILVRGDIDTP